MRHDGSASAPLSQRLLDVGSTCLEAGARVSLSTTAVVTGNVAIAKSRMVSGP